MTGVQTCALPIYILQPRHGIAFGATPGQTISLIPLGGRARKVTTTGLKWNLTKDTLVAFASRGVSNIAVENRVTISLRRGHLAVVIPFDLSSPTTDPSPHEGAPS